MDSKQAHAAENEWKNTDVELGRHRVAASRNQAAILRGLQRRGENISSDGVDDACPTRFLQRPTGSIVRLFAENDCFGAKVSQKIMLARFSRRGDHIEAKLPENCYSNAADSSGCA